MITQSTQLIEGGVVGLEADAVDGTPAGRPACSGGVLPQHDPDIVHFDAPAHDGDASPTRPNTLRPPGDVAVDDGVVPARHEPDSTVSEKHAVRDRQRESVTVGIDTVGLGVDVEARESRACKADETNS